MPFRWRKSIKIAPGLRLNLSNRGVRAQIGSSPLSFSAPLIGTSTSKRVTASLPGTGISFVHNFSALAKRPVARKRGQYEMSEDIDLTEMFVFATREAAAQQHPPLQIDELSNQPPEVLRVIFKTATWNLAVLAGHDPVNKPFIITDALLVLDGEKDEGLVELAQDCQRLSMQVNLQVPTQNSGHVISQATSLMAAPIHPDDKNSNIAAIVIVVAILMFALGYCSR